MGPGTIRANRLGSRVPRGRPRGGETPSPSNPGACGSPGWSSTSWRAPRPSSRSRTAVWACAEPWTRASPWACRGRTSRARTSCARWSTPRPGTAIPSRPRRWWTPSTARRSDCWSRAIRSTSERAASCTTNACWTSARAPCRASCAGARRAGVRRGQLHPAGVAGPARRARPALHGACAGTACRGRAESGLVANTRQPHLSEPPRRRRPARSPLEPQEHNPDGRRLTLMHRTLRTGLLVGTTTHHDVRRRRRGRPARRGHPRPRPVHRAREVGTRANRSSSRSSSATAGRPSVPGPRCATRWPPASPAHSTPAGRACWTTSGFLDRFWQGADVTVEGDPALQQAVRFALFHVLQNSVRAEGRPIAAKGLTGPGYEATASGTPRPSSCRCSSTPGPRPPRTTCGGGTGPSTRPASGPGRCTSTAPRSPGGPSTARSAPATGRRAPRRSTSTPTSRTASSATTTPPTTTSSTPRSGSRSSSRPRGCGARSATTTATALARRRRHRPGRVQRGRRRQRLHQSHGRAEPARRGRCRRRHPDQAGPSG